MADPVTLAEAGASLGRSPATLRSQIRHGTLTAKKVGNAWTLTPEEVERYRAEQLGRHGKRKATP